MRAHTPAKFSFLLYTTTTLSTAILGHQPACAQQHRPDARLAAPAAQASPPEGQTGLQTDESDTPRGSSEIASMSTSALISASGPQSGQDQTPDESNTIIVTGTLIRGIGASAGTKPIAITQEDIQRSGYVTASQMMAILPQNFISGYTEHAGRTIESNTNFTASTSPNLRGLGQKATLVLVNGRRLPAIGLDTTSLDISSIPASLIERIEVLPDGASSVYGADAVAGVVNVILKKSYDGAETRGRFGHVTEGGLRELNFS
ncbi:TonB-dependent receptor plug domain-containing protein [Pedomonas sp. V897]|uniref:TonB-dependent receptor plug domain-containing protein n=1 Tax=Pedomonas sp. V897 TaxID=3446482 RepID=UPI003EDED6E3